MTIRHSNESTQVSVIWLQSTHLSHRQRVLLPSNKCLLHLQEIEKRVVVEESTELVITDAPSFVRQLQAPASVEEGDSVHLEAQVCEGVT